MLWQRDDMQLDQAGQQSRIVRALHVVTEVLPLRFTCESYNDTAYALPITHIGDPPFDQWVGEMRSAAKFEWVAVNQRPYVALWMRISRVADYFTFHYNHWVPRGDTGYMYADCRTEPSDTWEQYAAVICAGLARENFTLASSNLLATRTPYMLDDGHDEIPDSDPRWNDDDFEPPPVPATIYACLFGDW